MFQDVEVPRFKNNQLMKLEKLSTLRTGSYYLQEIFPVFISVGG
jgi:hypothetical protein